MTIIADGVTDQTAVLQAAINAAITGTGVLALPPGNILITSKITINPANKPIAITGAGQVVTQIVHNGSFGDAVSMANCANSYFANFGIAATAKMASGANLRVNQAYRAHFDNISLQEGFNNLVLQNVTGATFRRIYTGGGSFFGGSLAGAYNLWLASDPGGVNNGIDFDGCYWEGGTGGQSYYDESVRVDNVDGAWFRGGHIFGGANVQVVINSGPAVTATSFHGVYFEHGATFGIIVQNPTSKVDGLTVIGCQFNNQPYPFALNGAAPPNCIIVGNRGMKTIPALPGSVVSNNL